MTALVAAQTLPMDKSVEIRSEWTLVEGSSMYLRPGESYSVRELLEGLLLASGNDGAGRNRVGRRGELCRVHERRGAEAGTAEHAF